MVTTYLAELQSSTSAFKHWDGIAIVVMPARSGRARVLLLCRLVFGAAAGATVARSRVQTTIDDEFQRLSQRGMTPLAPAELRPDERCYVDDHLSSRSGGANATRAAWFASCERVHQVHAMAQMADDRGDGGGHDSDAGGGGAARAAQQEAALANRCWLARPIETYGVYPGTWNQACRCPPTACLVRPPSSPQPARRLRRSGGRRCAVRGSPSQMAALQHSAVVARRTADSSADTAAAGRRFDDGPHCERGQVRGLGNRLWMVRLSLDVAQQSTLFTTHAPAAYAYLTHVPALQVKHRLCEAQLHGQRHVRGHRA